MKRNNKGFSLIELIVVIALVGVLTAVIAPALQQLVSSEARKCSSQIDSLLSKCKIFSMGRQGDVYIRIYEVNGKIMGEYIENGAIISTEQLGGRRASVSVTPISDAAYTISSSNSLYISFSRATGGLRLFSPTLPTTIPASPIEIGTAKIEVTASGKTYTVDIASSTGKHGVS